MALPSWMERVVEDVADAKPTVKVPFVLANKLFAVDYSGSTMGKIMAAQKECVLGLSSNHMTDMVCKGDFDCDVPRLVSTAPTDYFNGSGGTYSSGVLQQKAAVQQIRNSDLRVLLTDGEVGHSEVASLTRLAEEKGVTQVPVILLITGGKCSTPDRKNISVGISFSATAPDALFLYKDCNTGQLYLIDAKGVFAKLKDSAYIDLYDWGKFFDQDRSGRSNKGVSLGPEWDVATRNSLVNVSDLLNQERIAASDLHNLLAEEAFTQLALTCKTRGQLGQLRDIIIRHKQQEMTVRLEDRHGASTIMGKLEETAVPTQKVLLLEDLRRAHAANRATYQELKDSARDEAKKITELNRLIDRGLRIIAGFEKSEYTAEILKRMSNRAMRAETATTADTEVKLAALDLSDGTKALRGNCSICCGEQEIMSIVTKSFEEKPDQNTSDLALTAGLATGVSAFIQLFATILDRTLVTKRWYAKDLVEDQEVRTRREVLEWSLQNLLRNCPCRENFTETGKWVKYPEALQWAINDYEEASLDSWIVQYPVSGFSQLMRWYDILDLNVSKDNLVTIQRAKLLHLVTSKIMHSLLKEKDGDTS